MRSTSAKLLETLANFLGPEAAGPIAVAYSGGRDSGVLLWAAVQVAGPAAVTALYVDHGWRPLDELTKESAVVATWCRQLGVTLIQYRAPENPVRTEAGAREHRYASFRSYLDTNPGVICLAHHADDQAETILMRLLKGRSWQGLGGMPARRGAFRRPFLHVRGSQLAVAAVEQSVPFHEDSTNSSGLWTRNLLRREVFPLFQERFPRAIEALTEFGAVWGQSEAVRESDPGWNFLEGRFAVPVAVWNSWAPLRRQAELLALTKQSGNATRLSRRFLEAVCAEARNGAARGGGWFWARKNGSVFWGMVAPRAAKEYFIDAVQGREYDLGSYRVTWVTDPAALRVPGVNPSFPWVWRSFQPGMRFESVSGVWTRKQKRRRLDADETPMALVLQDGLIRAVVDPHRKRVVWSESEAGKLHKHEIFVTLVTVTPISTE